MDKVLLLIIKLGEILMNMELYQTAFYLLCDDVVMGKQYESRENSTLWEAKCMNWLVEV